MVEINLTDVCECVISKASFRSRWGICRFNQRFSNASV